MQGKMFNIKISTKSNINNELFRHFEELFDYEHQRIEQEHLLQQEIKYQQMLYLLVISMKYFQSTTINPSFQLEKNQITILYSSNTTQTMKKEMIKK
jgi:hypothetical protein